MRVVGVPEVFIFHRHDTVVPYGAFRGAATSGVTMRSAVPGSGDIGPSTAVPPVLGPLITVIGNLDESSSVQAALTPVVEGLCALPGIEAVELRIAPPADGRTVGPGGNITLAAGRAPDGADPFPLAIPLCVGRTLYGWLRVRADTNQPSAPLAGELEALARLVALHLERRQILGFLDHANRDMAEAHQALERQADLCADLHDELQERTRTAAGLETAQAVLSAVVAAQARQLADSPADEAVGELLDRLLHLTGSRAGLIVESDGAPLSLQVARPADLAAPDLRRLAAAVRQAAAAGLPGDMLVLPCRDETCPDDGGPSGALALIGRPGGFDVALASALAPAATATAVLLRAGRARDARYRTEQELRRATRRAERANLAKTEFLANIGHELRTPLNAIMGFAELLKTEAFGPIGEDDRYIGYAADIYDSGALLLQIINDILDVAKIETGRTVLQPDWVDATRLVAAVVRLVQPHAKGAGVTLETDLPQAGLPPLWADERLLKQALLNILSNAVKFTPAGGRVCLAAAMEPGALCFEVTDNGAGIAESELSLVFQPFYRGIAAVNRRNEGSGLGLPLARSFAELHGGSLTLSSTCGKGTTARIRIPCAAS
jgi:signal transduction histidine kinase